MNQPIIQRRFDLQLRETKYILILYQMRENLKKNKTFLKKPSKRSICRKLETWFLKDLCRQKQSSLAYIVIYDYINNSDSKETRARHQNNTFTTHLLQVVMN